MAVSTIFCKIFVLQLIHLKLDSVDWEKEKEEQYKNKKNKNKKQSEDSQSEEKKDGESKENEKIKLAKNAVLKLVNLPEKLDRDEIKKAFAAYPADIAHVEGPSDNTAFVRLRGEDDGKMVKLV